MNRPETRYARSGDVHVAYQVHGSGPIDLVLVPGFVSNLELTWDEPGYSHLLRRLGAFARVILFDKRGTGLSDPVSEPPTLEQRMDDVRAVMDAAGVARAALLGTSEGGPMSILFAATWPERTRALILYGTYAHFHSAVLPEDRLPSVVSMMEAEWGTGGSLRFFAPGRLSDAPFRAWWARLERLGASPRTAVALTRMNAQVDVRHVLPAVRVPTLVIHRRADVRVDPEAGRFIAGRIPGARHAELPGADHPIWTGDVDSVVEEIEEFLTGTRHHPAPPPDRVLATVSVAEIAETERGAAALGEADWSARLTGWRRLAEAETTRLRGRLAGPARADGTLVAVFDGPARAVRCGAVLRDAATAHLGRPLRCGLHAGEVALTERDDASGPGICGFALHAAIRIAALARPGEILVSTTVRDLLAGSGLRFRDRDLRLALPSDAGGGRLGLLALACDGRPPERAAIPAAPMAPSPGLLPGLSPRERDVLRLVAQGLSNGAIAAELALSEHTVKRHVANILAKLSLPTRAAAAVAAARAGLL